MKKAGLLIALILFSHLTFSQYIILKKNEDFLLKNADGSLVTKNVGFTEEGPTSIPETNCRVNVTTQDGKMYKNYNGRIDLRTGKFMYTLNGQDLLCTLQVNCIMFDSCTGELSKAYFRNGYPPIGKQNTQSFYQLLIEGKATLLKYYSAKWYDKVPFNTTNITRVYSQTISYYLYLNNRLFRLAPNNGNLLDLLMRHGNYVSKNTLDLKDELNAIEVVKRFNAF